MQINDWKAVRVMVEGYQAGLHSPSDRSSLKLAGKMFSQNDSAVGNEILGHLDRYMEAREQVANSLEARWTRLSTWLPLAGMAVVALGGFRPSTEQLLLGAAFVVIAPEVSKNLRFKEQFKTMRQEAGLALWKALHQEHGAPPAVQSTESTKPVSIDYFKGQLHDLFTSSKRDAAELQTLSKKLVDSPSSKAFLGALESFVNAREIVAHRARTSLAPCLGGAALFGALALAAHYAGHSGPSYFGRAAFACGVGAIGTSLYMTYSQPIQEARKAMRENLDKAMAYMPQPEGA